LSTFWLSVSEKEKISKECVLGNKNDSAIECGFNWRGLNLVLNEKNFSREKPKKMSSRENGENGR